TRGPRPSAVFTTWAHVTNCVLLISRPRPAVGWPGFKLRSRTIAVSYPAISTASDPRFAIPHHRDLQVHFCCPLRQDDSRLTTEFDAELHREVIRCGRRQFVLNLPQHGLELLQRCGQRLSRPSSRVPWFRRSECQPARDVVTIHFNEH